jgi:hypothetical protein
VTEKAVVDRFEGDQAVLLLAGGRRQLAVSRSQLPPGIRAGGWLQVEIKDDRLVRALVDPEETEKMRKQIDEKLARLRRGDHLRKS